MLFKIIILRGKMYTFVEEDSIQSTIDEQIEKFEAEIEKLNAGLLCFSDSLSSPVIADAYKAIEAIVENRNKGLKALYKIKNNENITHMECNFFASDPVFAYYPNYFFSLSFYINHAISDAQKMNYSKDKLRYLYLLGQIKEDKYITKAEQQLLMRQFPSLNDSPFMVSYPNIFEDISITADEYIEKLNMEIENTKTAYKTMFDQPEKDSTKKKKVLKILHKMKHNKEITPEEHNLICEYPLFKNNQEIVFYRNIVSKIDQCIKEMSNLASQMCETAGITQGDIWEIQRDISVGKRNDDIPHEVMEVVQMLMREDLLGQIKRREDITPEDHALLCALPSLQGIPEIVLYPNVFSIVDQYIKRYERSIEESNKRNNKSNIEDSISKLESTLVILKKMQGNDCIHMDELKHIMLHGVNNILLRYPNVIWEDGYALPYKLSALSNAHAVFENPAQLAESEIKKAESKICELKGSIAQLERKECCLATLEKMKREEHITRAELKDLCLMSRSLWSVTIPPKELRNYPNIIECEESISPSCGFGS